MIVASKDNKLWLHWWEPMPRVCKYLDRINSFTPATHDREVSSQLAICQWAAASSQEMECGKQGWTEAMGCENRGLERSWSTAEAEETQEVHVGVGSHSPEAGRKTLCWLVFTSQDQEFKSLFSYFLAAWLTEQCSIDTSICLRCYCPKIKSAIMTLSEF